MVFGDTRDSFVDKFIYNIKSDFTLKLAFEENVLSVINKILDENSNIFEDEYFNLINNNIKNTFIEQYTNIINEQTSSLLQFIQENKNIIKNKLDNLNSFKSNIILSDIENKANKLINVIEEYYIYNNNFEISDEVQLLLNNYCKNKILPYYNEFKSILDISTKNITIQNMENNIQKIKNKYIFNDFDTKSNVIRNNFKNSYFNNITDYLEHSYGSINSSYLINLEKEIAYFNGIRRLNDIDEDNKQKIADLNIDKTFKLLKKSSLEIVEYLKNISSYYSFDQKINKYISEINEQYNTTKNNLVEKEEILEDLKNYIIDYYTKVNSSYYQTKQFLQTSINEINDLIEKCATVTLEQINNKYINIKNGFQPINYKIKKEIPKELEKIFENSDIKKYIIDTEIDKYYVESEISLDIIFEKKEDIEIPKVIGKIINKNHPKRMVIDVYARYGNVCEIKGRRMTINFNNITMISDFVFDINTNSITINNSYEFDEYHIRNEKYIIVEKEFVKTVGGVTFIISNLCKSKLSGENEIQIISKKQSNIVKTINY